MNDAPVVTLSRHEALKLRKRIKARIEYHTKREHVRARNMRSKLKQIAQNPEGYKARRREYNKRYVERNRATRLETSRKYREANRDACIKRSVRAQSERKRRCPIYKLRCNLSTALWFRLNECKLRKAQGLKYRESEAFEWLEWLREKGYADWQSKGMEIDHVIPMARWNLASRAAQETVNGWQNLFPLSRLENRTKNKFIWPDYVRRVWRLRDEYLNERRR